MEGENIKCFTEKVQSNSNTKVFIPIIYMYIKQWQTNPHKLQEIVDIDSGQNPLALFSENFLKRLDIQYFLSKLLEKFSKNVWSMVMVIEFY